MNTIEDIRDMESLAYVKSPSWTWKVDFTKGRVVGFTDEADAVAQAAFMAIQTQRYAYLIFSWQYGSELETLIGKDPDYVYSEAKRMIRECLSVDTRITNVRDFAFKNRVISFTIDTIYGSKDIEIPEVAE